MCPHPQRDYGSHEAANARISIASTQGFLSDVFFTLHAKYAYCAACSSTNVQKDAFARAAQAGIYPTKGQKNETLSRVGFEPTPLLTAEDVQNEPKRSALTTRPSARFCTIFCDKNYYNLVVCYPASILQVERRQSSFASLISDGMEILGEKWMVTQGNASVPHQIHPKMLRFATLECGRQ